MKCPACGHSIDLHTHSSERVGCDLCKCEYSLSDALVAATESNRIFRDCLDRALKLWQGENPDKEFWPDGTANLAWVFGKLTAANTHIETLKAALEPFAEVYGAIVNEWGDDTFPDSAKFEIEYEHYKRAAEAMEKKP